MLAYNVKTRVQNEKFSQHNTKVLRYHNNSLDGGQMAAVLVVLWLTLVTAAILVLQFTCNISHLLPAHQLLLYQVCSCVS